MKNEGKKETEQAKELDKIEIREEKGKEKLFEVDRRSVYKCVQCGTCRSVCPVFDVVGWESANTRGRMLIIKSLLEGRPPFRRCTSKPGFVYNLRDLRC